MDWMTDLLSNMDPSISREKSVFLQINPQDSSHVLPCLWILAETLQFVWAKRRAKTPIRLDELCAEVAANCKMLELSQLYNKSAEKIKLLLDI